MTEERILSQLARELSLRPDQVRNAVALLDEGNTIPFIARYRKEVTGEMKEDQLRALAERLAYLRNLAARKAEVIRLVAEQGKLTPEWQARVEAAATLAEVEDLYRPFRPKRRTRATVAREKGLEPLADLLLNPPPGTGTPEELAAAFVDPDKGVADVAAALAGARDILAERIADDAEVRKLARDLTAREGVLVSKATGGGERAEEFEMYVDYREPVAKVPPHRVLALNRGERLEALRVTIEAPVERILEGIRERWLRRPGAGSGDPFAAQVEAALVDAYKRLIAPAIEREVRSLLTERAEEQAIRVFGENLRHLLLQPPVRGYTVMGIDPGYRTGCKVAVVDETGRLLDTATVYITAASPEKVAAGEETLVQLARRHGVGLVAIGNGTASRETEQVVARILPRMGEGVRYLIVNEAGASVYSASPLAGAELPHLDVSLRGAVSIARRVLDPLAELVKIEPRHIGVGQYQHDVDQKRLAEQLAAVVESVVNAVGVDLNTASPSLLQYVAGLKPGVARAIVAYREQVGRFTSRQELLKVPGLGEKTFVQCAGFLRVSGGENPLDNTAVHPESYHVADAILKAVGATRADLVQGVTPALRLALGRVDPERVARELGVGVPTVRDILAALQKPGRDPRDELPPPLFRTDVLELKDLRPGMELMGTVRNVVDFGAFVDIGVHCDGLVHVSELSHRYVRHPSEVVAVGDVVRVRVLAVDERRQRIRLTMKL